MLYEAIMRTSSKAQLIFAWHIYAIATTAHYPPKHIFSYPKSQSNYYPETLSVISNITFPALYMLSVKKMQMKIFGTKTRI